jgi:NIMA (never in mitosis gene a)-related kinase
MSFSLSFAAISPQGDLASQIKAAKRNLFSESKILHWFVQLALGLHYMHTSRVLHRDLKTQNIFLLGNGRLVLGDLGISKVLDGTMDFAQTCIGTPYCKFIYSVAYTICFSMFAGLMLF